MPRCFSWTGFVNLPRGKLGNLSCISTGLVALPAYAAAPTGPTGTGPTGTGPAAISDASTEAADARRAGRKKGLRVKVIRPAEAKGLVRVTVRGPHAFKKKITKTTTWSKARPGRYRIRAKTITLYDQTVKPTVRPKKVRIKANRKRKTSKVTYRLPTFCARSGSVAYGWGEGDHGRLGTTNSTDRLSPVVIPRIRGAKAITGGLTNVTQIVARREGVSALRSDGRVWPWGAGDYGQLGNGESFATTTVQRIPVKVALPVQATAIASGGYNGYALGINGKVYAWGNGWNGKLGNGTTGTDTSTPVLVSGLNNVTELAAGHATAYAVDAGGNLAAWGSNGQREVPDGSPTPPPYYSVPFITGSTGAIGAGVTNGYAIR